MNQTTSTTTKMQVGINYPWMVYGKDFGKIPSMPRTPWLGGIDRELQQFKGLGIVAVRWFLLCDGEFFGTQLHAPLSQEFKADFMGLLEHFTKADLKLLPSLVDFHCFRPPHPTYPQKQGRADLLRDPSNAQLMTTFLHESLDPLLEISEKYKKTIYAWELINEPEWVTQMSPTDLGKPGEEKTVPLAKMKAFIQEGVGRINAHHFLSTVGFGKYETLKNWNSPALGITLHQFHYYGDPAKLPAQTFDPRWPVFIGEIATDPKNHPWQELKGQNDVYHRLQHAAGKKYPATFLWSAHGGKDGATEWTPANQAFIKAFTSQK